MAAGKTTDLRTLAICGHGGVGKTVLTEAILLKTKITNRLGDPTQGTSIVDFDDEERKRQFSIYSTIVHAPWRGKDLQIIDTPGYDDFFGEVVGAFAAADTALIALSADAGIQVNTRRTWKAAGKVGLGRAIVITKMDAEHAKFAAVLDALRSTFGNAVLPITYPVGAGPSFSGVVNTLNPPADVPADIADQVAEVGQALRESIIESDEELMMRYLEEEEIGAGEIMAAASTAVASGSLVPVFCVAAEKGLGIAEMLDAMVAMFPSPADAFQRKGTKPGTEEEVAFESTEDAPFSAQVFKALYDPFVGKLAFFRIFSGSLKCADGLYNTRDGKREKVGHIYRAQGKEQEEIDVAVAGQILAVAKIESLEIGDSLCSEGSPVAYPALAFPTPMVSRAAEPKTRGDEQRMSIALSRISSQDKTFIEGRDPQTGELVITGMSELHLQVVMSKMAAKPFEVEMALNDPRIPYKETITAKADASFRHKKQTGGRGQFAEVHLRVAPCERGAGFEFVDAIYGGSIPRQYVPAVEKGVVETMGKGVIAGYQVVDVKAEVYDGKYHDVDSSEAAFKMASSRAFRAAFEKARPVLLEPIVDIEITFPTKYMGDISADLSGRRGRIQGMGSEGDQQIIEAQVPLAAVSHYSTQLRAMTGGEGSYTMEFSHYEPVPPNVQQEIVAKAKRPADEDD